jgi:hypothetical protein
LVSRRLPAALLVVALLAAGTAWVLLASAAPARVGTVVGAIVYSGGPAQTQAGAARRAGQVTAYRHGHAQAHASVAAGKRFRLRLQVGRYRLKATSGSARCAPKRVRVRHAMTVHVRIVCSVR